MIVTKSGSSWWSRLLNTLQIRNDYTVPPAGLKWRSNTFFILSTVAVGLFTDLFLYGLVVPVLPYMLEDRVSLPKHSVQSHVSAMLAVYAGASVLCSPIIGLIADKLPSRQGPFLFGLTALMLATFLLFIGESIPVLMIARALQGVSASLVWTIGLALCLETVGPKNLGKTIGSILGVVGVGNFAATIIGGILYEKTGYVGVFAVGMSVVFIDLVMRLLVIEKKVAKRYEVNDPSTVSDLNTTPGTGGCNGEGRPHDPENDEETPLLGRVNSDDSHYRLSHRKFGIAKAIPILPLLKDPRLLVALLISLIQAMMFGAFDATIPMVASEYFHFNSLKAGLLFLPLGILDLVMSPVFGWWVDRYGTKPVAVLSYALLVPVLVLLRIPSPGGLDQIIIFSVLLSFCGFALGGIGAPSIVEAGAIVQRYYEVNPDYFGECGPYAQLYGLSNMVFSLGLTVGPELAGELKQLIGYGNMNLVLAIICFVTAILAYLYIGGRPTTLTWTQKRNRKEYAAIVDDSDDSGSV